MQCNKCYNFFFQRLPLDGHQLTIVSQALTKDLRFSNSKVDLEMVSKLTGR